MAKAAVKTSVPQARVRTLDRSRAFGTVHPPEDGLHYEQGGFYFDADGVHVPRAGDPKTAPRPTTVPKAAPAQSADDAYDEESERATDAVTAPEVNLTAWALGTEKYVFGKVMKAFRDRFSTNITNEIDGLTFLIDEGVVTAAQVAEARGEDWAERA